MLQMSGEHPHHHQQHDYQSYRPLPSLSSTTTSSSSPPTLPQRLPSLARVRGGSIPSSPSSPPAQYRNNQHHSPSDSSSAASSPESSPRNNYAAVQHGVKRMRVAHASVHPSKHASKLVHTQRHANRHEEDVFISGAYKAQRKPAQNATVCSLMTRILSYDP